MRAGLPAYGAVALGKPEIRKSPLSAVSPATRTLLTRAAIPPPNDARCFVSQAQTGTCAIIPRKDVRVSSAGGGDAAAPITVGVKHVHRRPLQPCGATCSPQGRGDSMRRDGSRWPELLGRFQSAFLLSARETDVVELASLGHGCKEIAFQLGCRPPTVDVYWTRIYRKTGCRSHLEVMAALLKMSVGAPAHLKVNVSSNDVMRPPAVADDGMSPATFRKKVIRPSRPIRHRPETRRS